jgi:hypothetical protein
MYNLNPLVKPDYYQVGSTNALAYPANNSIDTPTTYTIPVSGFYLFTFYIYGNAAGANNCIQLSMTNVNPDGVFVNVASDSSGYLRGNEVEGPVLMTAGTVVTFNWSRTSGQGANLTLLVISFSGTLIKAYP